MAATLTAHTSAFLPTVQNQWALETFTFGPFTVGIASGTVVLGTDSTYPLFTVPYDCDVEKVTIRLTTAAAATADQIQIVKAASGTAVTSGTAMTASEELNTQIAANTPMDMPLTANTGLASGATIGLLTAGTIVAAAGLVIAITLRKNTGKGTNDNSTSNYKTHGVTTV